MRLSARLQTLVTIGVLAAVLAGCAAAPAPFPGSRQAAGDEGAMAYEEAPAQPAMPMATAAPAAIAPGGDQGSAAAQTGAARMLIHTADMALRVRDVQVAVSQARALAADHGGYVVNLNTWTQGEEEYASMTIRVPAERFDQMLNGLDGLADKVERSNVTGQDITEEYYDIEGRLTALRATEEQLLLLLEDVRERMQKAEDILAVYRELQNIQSQIEQLEGRKRYLESMVAMSTINLSLMPVEGEPPVLVAGWAPGRTARDALRSLTRTGQGLADIAIWAMLYLLPVTLVLVAPLVVLFLVLRAVVRRRKDRAPAAGAPGSPAA